MPNFLLEGSAELILCLDIASCTSNSTPLYSSQTCSHHATSNQVPDGSRPMHNKELEGSWQGAAAGCIDQRNPIHYSWPTWAAALEKVLSTQLFLRNTPERAQKPRLSSREKTGC